MTTAHKKIKSDDSDIVGREEDGEDDDNDNDDESYLDKKIESTMMELLIKRGTEKTC